MNILLYAPEYRPNLSNMIRSAEFFGFQHLYLFDKNGLLNPPNNKVSRAEMNHIARVWTAGAIEFMDIRKVENIHLFLKDYTGRKIATELNPSAQHLKTFQFQADDLIIMGSEKEGLPADIIALCDAALYLPNIGHTSCLNVSVTLGILLYAAQTQLQV